MFFGIINSNRRKGVVTMPSEVIIATITGLSSLAGASIGAIASSKLTNYRLEQLEKKVDNMSDFSQRLALVEQRIETVMLSK